MPVQVLLEIKFCTCTVSNDIPADAPPFLPDPLFLDISSSSNLYKTKHQH